MFYFNIPAGARLLSLIAAIGIATCGAAFAQAQVKTNEQLEALRKRHEARKESAIVFFVAKGIAGSCGLGCNTWIAAEGSFDTEAPERLRKLLNKYSRSNLPIYFGSSGGDGQAAEAIGRLLRERKMVAGVGWTFPDQCFGAGTPVCERLQRSGEELSSELSFHGASCSSACVYALAGATVREVSPEAKIGVHASLIYSLRRDGKAGIALPGSVERTRASTKRYFSEMGIDVALYERAERVPHTDIDYLTREEIVRFKIDNRKSTESHWFVERKQKTWFVAKKSFFDQRPGREPGSNSLELSCNRQEITITYRRFLDAAELETRSAIKFAAHAGSVDFPEATGSGEPRLGASRSGIFPVSFFEEAARGPNIEIAETFLPENLPPRTTTTRLSTAGLAESLKELQASCW
jgi:hypothetical protein